MNTPLTQEQKVIHFLNRTSFGPTREAVQGVNRLGIHAYLEEQLRPERISDTLVEEKLAGLKTMRLKQPRADRTLPAAQNNKPDRR